MKTQFFYCDICKSEIKGKIAVFVFNEILVNADFQQVPVNKQADFCDDCAQKIIVSIDNIAKEYATEKTTG